MAICLIGKGKGANGQLVWWLEVVEKMPDGFQAAEDNGRFAIEHRRGFWVHLLAAPEEGDMAASAVNVFHDSLAERAAGIFGFFSPLDDMRIEATG